MTPARVQSFVSDLQTQVSPSTVAIYADHWLMALRVLAPEPGLASPHQTGSTPQTKCHAQIQTPPPGGNGTALPAGSGFDGTSGGCLVI